MPDRDGKHCEQDHSRVSEIKYEPAASVHLKIPAAEISSETKKILFSLQLFSSSLSPQPLKMPSEALR